MQTNKARLLLADDHEEVLQQIAAVLGRDFQIVGMVKDGSALLHAAAELKPDVVVTDYTMPGMNGIEAGRQLLSDRHCSAVVLLTLHEERHVVKEALAAGIRGYVLKRNAAEDLALAVNAALQGRAYVPAEFLPWANLPELRELPGA
ncbi:MAG: response regulator transcription factor [Bryobacterales bacterium]|nr:response regulator transcription factor [Bryobacterales bacterium]MBV9397092.1 response regulator transcription factor [Bryobacterales bacterium]